MATAQYFAALAANLGGLANGIVMGYSSPVAPLFINGTGHNLKLTDSQFSWFSSTVNLGALLGSLISGYIMNYIGRRGTLVLIFIPFSVGWGIVAGSLNFAMLIIGRLLTGMCAGICSAVVPTFIGEYSSPHRRGLLGSGYQLMVMVGILYAYCVGAKFNSFRYIAVACAIIPILLSALMFITKESPSYLLLIKKKKEAKEALQYYRGKGVDISEEYETMQGDLEDNRHKNASFKDLNKPFVMRPLIIGTILMIAHQFTGMNAVLFNLTSIFIASGSKIDEEMSTIIVGLTHVFANLLGTILVDKVGRRILLNISGVSMTISLVALGAFFYMLHHVDEQQAFIAKLGWLPLTSLVVYSVAFSTGFGPVPWIMMGELFSVDVSELTSSIVTVANWTSVFIVTLAFNPLQDYIHDFGVYWVFACLCFLSVVFAYFVIPETKGKSIHEITVMFGAPDHHHQVENGIPPEQANHVLENKVKNNGDTTRL